MKKYLILSCAVVKKNWTNLEKSIPQKQDVSAMFAFLGYAVTK